MPNPLPAQDGSGAVDIPDTPADGWPAAKPASTGDPAVDALLAPLSGLAAEPVSNHASVYASLHAGLLAELNTEVS